jgi:hypothetical protein
VRNQRKQFLFRPLNQQLKLFNPLHRQESRRRCRILKGRSDFLYGNGCRPYIIDSDRRRAYLEVVEL